MTVRIFYDTKQSGPKLQHGTQAQGERIGVAVANTAVESSREILVRGRADMKAAGNFGSARWQQGLHADINAGQQRGADGRFQANEVRIKVFHDVPYFSVFQEGRVIHGRPMLWIPLSFAGVPKGMYARDFPGGLFRVNRGGSKAPLLLSRVDRRPKYFGKLFVTIPKKFHIKEITIDVARKMKAVYSKYWNK